MVFVVGRRSWVIIRRRVIAIVGTRTVLVVQLSSVSGVIVVIQVIIVALSIVELIPVVILATASVSTTARWWR